MKIPFNEPYFVQTRLSGPDVLRTLGKYYDSCKEELEKRFNSGRILLTPSCTAALEIISLVLDIKPGEEIILPSYTYVSTANAFALRGAKLIFADTYYEHPAIDLNHIEALITPKTKAIIVVHYAGVAVNYNAIKTLKKKYKIPIIEDAAHCFGSKSGNDWIGKVGDFSTFSFHETKNISCGQGGALIINNKKYWDKANVVAYCGTDKLNFIKGKVKSYGWNGFGSNYLLAEPLCAILLANLKNSELINKKRLSLWKRYYRAFENLSDLRMPEFAGGNGHIFYLVSKNKKERNNLISFLKGMDIEATFHYSPLHLSPFSVRKFGEKHLPNTERFGNCLVRLPLYYRLTTQQQDRVIKAVKEFYGGKKK